jgi:hypothetical protein
LFRARCAPAPAGTPQGRHPLPRLGSLDNCK